MMIVDNKRGETGTGVLLRAGANGTYSMGKDTDRKRENADSKRGNTWTDLRIEAGAHVIPSD